MRRGEEEKDRRFIKPAGLTKFRILAFYILSLFLSLILIIVSVTVIVTIVYLNGYIRVNDFYVFVSVVAVNLGLLGFSIRGIMAIYSDVTFGGIQNRFSQLTIKKSEEVMEKAPGREKLTREFFTETELEIIDVLMKNNNHILQSKLIGSVGVSKASISRALTSLENKGIIVKVRRGMTNEIVMPETYFK
jgi:DNA-binding transcriptional ArsR family regulator